jgi:hypothetical protein
MDDTQRLMYSLMARLALYTRRGIAFQDLFSDIAERVFPGDFIRVRPAGKIGDKKCDGYLQSKQRVYASYAPRDMTPSTLQAKVKDDFAGALANWPNMKEWHFVHNDTDGLDAGTLQLIELLKNQNKKVLTIQVMGPLDVHTLALSLPPESLAELFGQAAGTKEMVRYGYPEIAAVVDTLSLAGPEGSTEGEIIAPSPKKLARNALGSEVAQLLRKGEIKAREFQQFFAETANELQGESIANWFRERYRSLEDNSYDTSHIFYQLLEDAGGLARPTSEQAAVLGLLSYLFHSCDIFRDDEELDRDDPADQTPAG